MSTTRLDVGGRTWDRLAAATGIVFVVLVLLSFFIQGEPPAIDDPAQEIANRFTEQDAQVRTGAFLVGLALIFFLWFIGTLVATIRRGEDAVARQSVSRLSAITLAGATVDATLIVVGTTLSAGLAVTTGEQVGADAAASLFRASQVILNLSAFATVTWMAAASLGILRTAILPTWLGWSGLAVAALWLISGFYVFDFGNDALSTLGFITLLIWLAWVLAASVLLSRSLGEGTTTTAEPARG